MGIVLKQSFKGAIYSYIGVILGGLNVAILFPIIFSEEEIGLINILISVSAICAQFASLGSAGVINYFFPKFRDKESGHNSFFIFISLFASLGFFIFTIIFYFWGHLFLSTQAADTSLQYQYYCLLYPLTFFTLGFIVVDMFSTSTFKSTIGTLYKDVFVRLIILILCVLYYYNWIDFTVFLTLYTLNIGVPVIALLVYLLIQKDIVFKWPKLTIYRPHLKKIFSVGLFYVLSGLSNILATYIDKFMIGFYLGLGPTGIYSITNYFGALTRIPRSSMGKIGVPIVAKLIEEKNFDELSKLLKKSILSQILIGTIVFIVVWVNIDSILSILPPVYMQGKWVVFYISISFLVYCFQGFGGVIIQVSKHYKYSTYFTIVLGVLVVLFNYLFIPIWGIIGAAISTVLAKTIFVLINLLFISKTLKMQVFFKDSLKIVISGIVAYVVASLITEIQLFNKFYVDVLLTIAVKTILISVVYILVLFVTRFIKDISIYKKYL